VVLSGVSTRETRGVSMRSVYEGVFERITDNPRTMRVAVKVNNLSSSIVQCVTVINAM